jgi:hypothetical protein
MNPAHAAQQSTTSKLTHAPRPCRRSHDAQKRRLDHARQRSRTTRSPQSAQKFGL